MTTDLNIDKDELVVILGTILIAGQVILGKEPDPSIIKNITRLGGTTLPRLTPKLDAAWDILLPGEPKL